MKTFFPAIVVTAVILLVALIFKPTEYDNELEVQEISKVIQSMVVITTVAEVERNGSITESEMQGIAIMLDGGYILAETHATTTLTERLVYTPFGILPIAQKILNEKHFIGDIEIKKVGNYKDIALFQAPFLTKQAVKFGDAKQVKIGTKVVIVGWSLGKGINIKNGIVSCFVETTHYDPPQFSIKDIAIMISAPVNPGDSGSPLLAFRDGKYEIVGLVCAKIMDSGLGFAYTVDFVLDGIKKIKENL
jgi:S1-C subfamily serine protease